MPEIPQLGKNRDKSVLQIVPGFVCILGVSQADPIHFRRQHTVKLFVGPVIPRNTGINYVPDVFQVVEKFFFKIKDNYRLLPWQISETEFHQSMFFQDVKRIEKVASPFFLYATLTKLLPSKWV